MPRALPLFALIVLPFLAGCQVRSTGVTLPSSRYLEHPPQYIPVAPGVPASPARPGLPPPLKAQPGPAYPADPLAAPSWTSDSNKPPHPRALTGTGNGSGFPAAPSLNPAPSDPLAQPPARATPLVVANVRKETLVLYRVKDGELTFVQEIGAGDAADVTALRGEKLAVTFNRAPYCTNYTVKGQPGEVWLVRHFPVPPAPTSAPAP